MSWDWHVLGTSSCSECVPLCVSLCLWSRDFRGNAGINCTNWVRMTPRLIKSRVGDHKTMSEHSSCTQGSFCYVSLCCQREGVQPIVGGPPQEKKGRNSDKVKFAVWLGPECQVPILPEPIWKRYHCCLVRHGSRGRLCLMPVARRSPKKKASDCVKDVVRSHGDFVRFLSGQCWDSEKCPDLSLIQVCQFQVLLLRFPL